MSDEIDVLKGMYECFNSRNVGGVLAAVTDEVMWANAIEGGHEHGRDAVRNYWSRQFEQVRVQVKPVGFTSISDNSVAAEVEQSVHDLDGNPVGDDAHSLQAKTVRHIFRFDGGNVSRFDVADV